jgi:hypothetical protein
MPPGAACSRAPHGSATALPAGGTDSRLDSSRVHVSPEGLLFVPRTPDDGWLVVTSEVSGTVSVWPVSARH